jgi:hypothetical protein
MRSMPAILAMSLAAATGFALANVMRRRGQPAFAWLTAGAACIASAPMLTALSAYGAGEVLAGLLTTAALLAALRGRVVPAAALLVVALAVEPWAAIALPALLWFRLPRRTPDDVLGLLALLLVVGGLPMIFALVAWEGLTRRGVPVASLFVAGAALAVEVAGWPHEVAALPAAAWVAVRLFAPSLRWRRRAWPLPVPREPATR